MEKPQFVETSNKTARFSLIIGCTMLALSLLWLFLAVRPAFDDIERYNRWMNFVVYLPLSLMYILFYFSYSKPNLFLYWDRLIIHSFHSKGEIPLNDVVRLTTGYRLPFALPRKNQTGCLNNMYTRKNKILIKLNRPVRFFLPFGRTKFVDEIIIDVLDPDRFAWNLYMRNPAIEFAHSPQVIKTYESPTPLVELRARI
jgi:hypothetical protein